MTTLRSQREVRAARLMLYYSKSQYPFYMTKTHNLSHILASLLSVFVVFATYVRIHFGISLSDESFYVALPYRFVLGDRPFIDELNSLQLFAYLTRPVVWLYYTLKGSSDGLMLFMRASFIAFNLLVGAVLFHTLKSRMDRGLALVVSLLPLCFVPFSIPNLSYNTVGVGLFSVGLFLTTWPILLGASSRVLIPAGICLGLSVMAYPSLVAAVLFASLGCCLLSANRRVEYTSRLVLGGALVVVWVALLIPWEEMAKSLSFTAGSFAGFSKWGWPKAYALIRDFYYWGPSKPTLAFLALGIVLIRSKLPFLGLVLLLGAPYLCWIPLEGTSLGALQISMYFALMAPFFLVLSWNKKYARYLFALVWLPSSLAAFLTAFTSTNATPMAGLGFFPGAIVSLVLLTENVNDLASRVKWVGQGVSLIPAVLLVGMFLSHHLFVVYRDARLSHLEFIVRNGPFEGLHTTSTRKVMLEQLHDDLISLQQPGSKILFYDHFPAGYLMTSMRPASMSVWNCIQFSRQQKERCRDHYKSIKDARNIIVNMDPGEEEDRLLHDFVRSYHRKIITNPKYEIYSQRQETIEHKS